MEVYAIILNEPDEEAWDRVRNEWPKNYILSDSVALVVPDAPVSLTGDIAEKVGMNQQEGILGVVVEVGSNNGYNHVAFWEWLRKFE